MPNKPRFECQLLQNSLIYLGAPLCEVGVNSDKKVAYIGKLSETHKWERFLTATDAESRG